MSENNFNTSIYYIVLKIKNKLLFLLINMFYLTKKNFYFKITKIVEIFIIN